MLVLGISNVSCKRNAVPRKMLTKIYWRCGKLRREVYAIRKMKSTISGFTYPIALEGHKFLPHWTYHSNRNRPPKIHHRSRSGKVLNFMTLEEPYLQSFQNFNGIVWSVPGIGAPFTVCHPINILGHPEEPHQEITFPIGDDQVDWIHYLNVLLIERLNYDSLYQQALDQLNIGYHVISSRTIQDGNEPNILVVFSRNRISGVE